MSVFNLKTLYMAVYTNNSKQKHNIINGLILISTCLINFSIFLPFFLVSEVGSLPIGVGKMLVLVTMFAVEAFTGILVENISKLKDHSVPANVLGAIFAFLPVILWPSVLLMTPYDLFPISAIDRWPLTSEILKKYVLNGLTLFIAFLSTIEVKFGLENLKK